MASMTLVSTMSLCAKHRGLVKKLCRSYNSPPFRPSPPLLKLLLMTRFSRYSPTSIEHLSRIYRASIEHLSNIYRASIENLSNIYRTSIEHLWIWARSGVDTRWIRGVKILNFTPCGSVFGRFRVSGRIS